MIRNTIFLLFILLAIYGCKTNEQTSQQPSADTLTFYNEPYRPQIHFSPKEKWMNDPNGMVYYNGEYHLFYQHYPEDIVWGPMHWGHAVSKDLVHWTHLPIALYPDSLGLIFSGSAVVDQQNTTGFGTENNPALVAMFTYHSMEKEKAGRTDYQYQGIAFSLDSGRSWTKYENNPVIKNQGIKDFRDPKVFWHDQTKKWIVILAVKDHIELWNSADLKNWSKLSDFGADYGSHGGVWECPDLFELKVDNTTQSKWVMLVSINPGGPNGGSATQYFIGDFDGKTFKPDLGKDVTTWLDYGPDNYAGVTWSNIADGRKIFLGWMSNWAYAQDVPTAAWRSANTLPRDITLTKVGNRIYAKSTISPEVHAAASQIKTVNSLSVKDSVDLTTQGLADISQSIITGEIDAKAFELALSNSIGEKLTINYDQKNGKFVIDRSKAGRTDFSKNYPTEINATRIAASDKINFTIVTDLSSVEVLFDDGLTVMTSLFFAEQPLTKITVSAPQPLQLHKLEVKKLESIWNNN